MKRKAKRRERPTKVAPEMVTVLSICVRPARNGDMIIDEYELQNSIREAPAYGSFVVTELTGAFTLAIKGHYHHKVPV